MDLGALEMSIIIIIKKVYKLYLLLPELPSDLGASQLYPMG